MGTGGPRVQLESQGCGICVCWGRDCEQGLTGREWGGGIEETKVIVFQEVQY